MIENEPRIYWEWYPLQCLNMSKEALISLYDQYRDDPEATEAFWSHPEITLDMMDGIDASCSWVLVGIIKNPNLTWDFIIDNLDVLSSNTSRFRRLLTRDNWTASEGIAKKRERAATVIQRWYRRVTIFDLTFPRAEKKFRLAMEEMYP